MIRASKSGLSRDVQNKIDAKYCEVTAQECLTWIQEIINERLQNGEQTVDMNLDGSPQNFYGELKDGYVLARLANAIQQKSIPESKVKRQAMAFRQMELIDMFLKTIKDLGLRESDLFQTVDLYERQNLHQVTLCIQALGRKAPTLGLIGFGPKESEANKREFSEEKLREGRCQIGLQMGWNKGATQAGMNFGKTRSILD